MPSFRREEWPWKGNSDTSLAQSTKALRAAEPRLGRVFVKGDSRARSVEPTWTIADYLISSIGSSHYGNLLQTLTNQAPPRKRRRQRRRPRAVAA